MGHGASGRDGHAGRGRAVHARHAQCLDDLFGRRRARPGLRAMGNSAVDYFSGNREDYEHPYSTALVALDITSGEVAWVFQTVHNDVGTMTWPRGARLPTFPWEGQSVPAVILPTKQGDIFVLTGAPASRLPRCRSARCRPASCLTNSCRRLSPSRSACRHSPSPSSPNATPGLFTLDQLWCRIQFLQSDYEGMYTLPSVERPFIQYPGYNGGNDWGGGSLTERGIFVANYTDLPMRDQLIRREEADEKGMVPLGEPGGRPIPAGRCPRQALLRHLDQAMAQRPDRYPLHPATLRRNHGHRPGHP